MILLRGAAAGCRGAGAPLARGQAPAGRRGAGIELGVYGERFGMPRCGDEGSGDQRQGEVMSGAEGLRYAASASRRATQDRKCPPAVPPLAGFRPFRVGRPLTCLSRLA